MLTFNEFSKSGMSGIAIRKCGSLWTLASCEPPTLSFSGIFNNWFAPTHVSCLVPPYPNFIIKFCASPSLRLQTFLFFCNTSAHPCSQFCQNVSLVPELFLACRVAHNLCGKDVRDAIIRYKASLAQNFFKIKPITIFMRSELRMPYRVQLITNSLL